MVEPYHRIYNKLLSLDGTGIADVKTGQSFPILCAIFGEHEINLLPDKVESYLSQHPEIIVESDMTHADMLGLTPINIETRFWKRHVEDCDISTINKQLGEQQAKLNNKQNL